MKVALICGGGKLPQYAADALLSNKIPFSVIQLKSEVHDGLKLPQTIRLKILGWGQIGYFFEFLAVQQCTHILAVGSITRRPDFSAIKIDWGGLKSLPEIFKLVKGGDDTVLGNVARFFEKRGFIVISILDIVPEIVCQKGVLTKRKPSKDALKDIQLAFEAATVAGKLDMGQGAVVAAGRVLAIEGAEGTDQMLERISGIAKSKRAYWRSYQGILAKCVKPSQDLRFDVPTVGVKTILQLKKTGLAGLALQAGKVLLLEKNELINLANEAGIFITGVDLNSINLKSSISQ